MCEWTESAPGGLLGETQPSMKRRIVSALLFCALATASARSETPEEAAERLKWWREARFGMFLHWSPSSVNGTEIGWGRKAKRPMEAPFNGGSPAGPDVDPVYDNLYKQFNPVDYDPKEWVKLAEDAGMKYLVLTAKHHEGFSMWPTKARSGFDISAAPYKSGKGDILREFSDACHAANMRFGWYYSPRDWTHPDYGAGDNAKYETFMTKQVDELMSNYGKIDVIWWDSFGVGDSYAYWHADRFLNQVRKLQPRIVTNNRCSFYQETNREGLQGDFDTPEQKVGNYQIDRPWESCITLVGHNWSFHPGGKMMEFDKVVATLVSCATGDGNLLLNTGPMADGRIEPRQADLLREVGGWMKKYGESIYSTRGGPFRNGGWGGATFRDNIVYVHVLPSAPDKVMLPKLGESLVSSSTLTEDPVKVSQVDGRIVLQLSKGTRKGPATLVKLVFDKTVTRVDGGAELSESLPDGLRDLGRGAVYTASSLVAAHSREKDTLLTGACKGAFAFHTEDEKNPSIVIDLGKEQRVTRVDVRNREGYEDRAKTLTLSVSDDGKTWKKLWLASRGEPSWKIEPEEQVNGAPVKGASARYLKLETFNDTPTALHLRSVRIFGE